MSNEDYAASKKDWIYTWGVVRDEPNIMVGAFRTKAEAEARAMTMGEGYKATYIFHLPGTDEFIIEDEPKS
ncbi:hypothetical protein [Pseudomonas viridiflava]|uniref:hypothetical protein n=1 Tax=Pseudomonas viridiflava TaxID=33069 RepID=UPI001C31A506|nr:hypothetical protein [Pseudomonas viridiflava]QXG35478.1 hypothetical protein KTT61_26130 [Pseudomonas viridiflava]